MDLNTYLAISTELTDNFTPDIEISATPNGFQADFTFCQYELNIKVIITEDYTTITVLDDDFNDVHENGTQQGSIEWINREIRTARRTQEIVRSATA